MTQFELRDLGWQPHFDQQVQHAELSECLIGRVSAHFGSHVLMITQDEEISVPSSLVEIFNESGNKDTLAIGDWVLLTPDEHRLVRRLERKTIIARKAAGELIRPQLIAANVDTVFIVSSCNQDFNPSRLERYLALVLESEAQPVVVLTKSDLHDDPDSLRQIAESLHPGLIVVTLDARQKNQADTLNDWCGAGKTVALLGSSGVGKSTLANSMCGVQNETSGIREDDAKGRHTTTARSMHRLEEGGWLIDNPGMRELQLADCEQGVADLFDDVLQIAQHCKFGNCSHQGDAGCALAAAVESGDLDPRRFQNYLKLQTEQSRNSASLAERHEKDRKLGKFYKQVISEKQNRKR
jgi:ribosome biogenesis GTPase